MFEHNTIRSIAATATIVICAATGCHGAISDSLAHAEQVAASCPSDGSRVAALVASDESGSRHGATAQPAQQHVLQTVAERTAICGGHLRVVIFAGSTVGLTVFDEDLQLDGATATARLRKTAAAVDAVMQQINTALSGVANELPDGATDVVGQYQPGAEYLSQLSVSEAYRLEETVLTDGIQTAEPDLSDPALTSAQAETLAATVTVPTLPGADVRLIGIGRQTDGSLLPTPYVAALRAFHTAVCKRTQATCTVVTDAAGA
ncbi:hypothetical protein ORI20_30815 [Mycobacterium sp. CVI_P3]|uniref:VWFA domain-containing protein n=1 Tax=Mycobacterium pinniadriaticum TaxID=2994102 RepID=A0ABT3SNH7_9MYCO|nr:hypothetical protein [Mycobacterium pinniadriaticum]MCX2934665.1 hypothetical protein [Mycobacterium pinniadriaticum]MCX2941087.1 hypothetical protein [Mycobacterium pinniadriaticum]